MPFDAIPSRSAALRSLLRVSATLDMANGFDRDYLHIRLSEDLGRAADYLTLAIRMHARGDLTNLEFLESRAVADRTIDDLHVALAEVASWSDAA